MSKEMLDAKARKSELLPCPAGITSYKEISSERYYVDKTLMIKDLIDDRSKVMLFTRPHGFGKTLAMDTLKTFFEKTNEDNSVYFSKRAIWSCGETYRSYQGAFPVIFLSFKDSGRNTWKDMYESLTLSIREEFKRHADILKNSAVDPTDKAFFQKIVDGDAAQVDYQASIGQLSHMLSDVYRTSVVVLIDECDAPIRQGYNYGYYDEVIEFMRNLFVSALKDNNSLELSVLTGVLRASKESLFSGFNNLVVNSILDEKYAQYFGFTSREVKEMASCYGKSEKLDEIREWYGGYLFGKTEIYNPCSIINYFNNYCAPKTFWSHAISKGSILDAIKNGSEDMRKSLVGLLDDQPLRALVDTDIIYPEVYRSEDTIYSFLVMVGYLKVSETIASIDDVSLCSLLIPNKEIRSTFKKEIVDKLSNEFSPSESRG